MSYSGLHFREIVSQEHRTMVSLVREDSTCCETAGPCTLATKSVLWSPRAATTEAHVPGARALQEKPPTQESMCRSPPLQKSLQATTETQHSLILKHMAFSHYLGHHGAAVHYSLPETLCPRQEPWPPLLSPSPE